MSASHVDMYHPIPLSGSLELQSHRPHALVEAVKAYAQQDAAEKQQTCREVLAGMVRRICGLLRMEETRAQNAALDTLGEVRDLLSTAIFMDALKGVDLVFVPDYLERRGRFGSTAGSGADVYIVLDPFPRREGGLPKPGEVVPTLVHELCHAVLAKFSCENEFCQDEACHGAKDLETGTGYHGTAWQELASFVQGLTPAYFGKLLNLDIESD